MKKFLSTLAVFAMAAAVFTGCKKDEEKPAPTGKAKLSIPATLTVAPEGTVKLEITSSANASADIAVEVKSSDAATVSAEPASVTIKKGTKSAEVTLKGLKEGSADITITTASEAAEISAGKCTVTVGTIAAEVYPLEVTQAEWGGWEFFGSEGGYFNIYNCTYGDQLSVDITDALQIDCAGGSVMGTLDSNGFAIVAAVNEGDAIVADNMVAPTTDRPVLYAEALQATALATGSSVYIALMIPDYYESPGEYYRAWAKIKLGAGGTLADITVEEAYYCPSADASFKVGQK